MSNSFRLLASAFAVSAAVFSVAAQAEYRPQYEVTITNISPGQTFTPQLVVTHRRSASIFQLGEPASESLEILAEGGDTGPLTDDLFSDSTDARTIDGLLAPGQSISTVLQAHPGRDGLSLAAMLIPTNDTFVALNNVSLPRSGSVTYTALAYDAGTEVNDQNCANIPGPRCGGEGFSVDGGEGFVHVSNGFHELAADPEAEILGPQVYDWRNPVAQITVRRVR